MSSGRWEGDWKFKKNKSKGTPTTLKERIPTKIFIAAGKFRDKKNGSKMPFWYTFWKLLYIGLFKITIFWPPLDGRVAKIAKNRVISYKN